MSGLLDHSVVPALEGEEGTESNSEFSRAAGKREGQPLQVKKAGSTQSMTAR